MSNWARMTETQKPEPGFVYQCPHDHEWFIPMEAWAARGENNCPACEVLNGEGTSSRPAD